MTRRSLVPKNVKMNINFEYHFTWTCLMTSWKISQATHECYDAIKKFEPATIYQNNHGCSGPAKDVRRFAIFSSDFLGKKCKSILFKGIMLNII